MLIFPFRMSIFPRATKNCENQFLFERESKIKEVNKRATRVVKSQNE